MSNSTEPTVVVQKAYDWALWIIPKVEKFPKSYRFSIGQSLVTASIELLLDLVDATYQARLSLCRVCGARPGRCLGQWAGTGFIHGDSGSANSASASVGPDVRSMGVKQQADPGFLVAHEANVNPGWTKGWRSMLNCSYLRTKAFPLNLTVRWPMIQLSLFLPPPKT